MRCSCPSPPWVRRGTSVRSWWSTAARVQAAARRWPRRSAPISWSRSRSAIPGAAYPGARLPTGSRREAELPIGMTMSHLDLGRRRELTLPEKIWTINWGLVLLVSLLACVGFGMLYSAANGHWDPWASKQIVRYGVALAVMLVCAVVDLKFWYRSAYWIYGIAFLLLVAVEVRGFIGMGAQRWIDLGVIQLQPSEIMKVAAVLVLARYFHNINIDEIGRPLLLILPAGLILVPAALVMKQPDLGTALMLVLAGGVMFFLSGVRLWKFAILIAAGGAGAPLAWRFLKPYQKARLVSFLDPESDPQGTGYH